MLRPVPPGVVLSPPFIRHKEANLGLPSSQCIRASTEMLAPRKRRKSRAISPVAAGYYAKRPPLSKEKRAFRKKKALLKPEQRPRRIPDAPRNHEQHQPQRNAEINEGFLVLERISGRVFERNAAHLGQNGGQ